MDQFLASVERKAFTIAKIATRNDDDALDVVQDAMLGLVQSYAHKPASEWPALFYTILNSRIQDWYRRGTVRKRRSGELSNPGADDFEQEQRPDPFAQVAADKSALPEEQIVYDESAQAVEQLLAALPQRQQQAFLLRMWEGLSVEETAQVMECSTGSVKTHCSRAIEKLKHHFKPVKG